MADDAPAAPELAFPVRLRVLRLRAGLSQTELAAALGLHPSSISSYESGRRQPRDPGAFEARVREAIAPALPAPAAGAAPPSSTSDSTEVLNADLSLDDAQTCLALIGRLADAYGFGVEARLQREAARAGYRLRVRVVAAGERRRAAGTSTT